MTYEKIDLSNSDAIIGLIQLSLSKKLLVKLTLLVSVCNREQF